MTHRIHRRSRRRERGFSLIVSLVLLVLITLVALASMRSVAMQSRMTATSHDRNIAFQAAETALRNAEATALASVPGDYPAAGCSGGRCAAPAAGAAPRWNDSSTVGWTTTTAGLSANAQAPDTVVEYMGTGEGWPGCSQSARARINCTQQRYRVTARSTGDDRATVILQSDIATP